VRIHSSREYRVSTYIDRNLDEYIEVINKDNLLKIEVKRRMANDFFVDIYCPNVLGITIKGLGRIELVDKMITPSLEIKITGAGKIEGAIECDRFSVNVDGTGSIEISGSSHDADININVT
jgi:hypothetical protein